MAKRRHDYLDALFDSIDGMSDSLDAALDSLDDSLDKMSDDFDSLLDELLGEQLEKRDRRVKKATSRRDKRLDSARKKVEEAAERMRSKSNRKRQGSGSNVVGGKITITSSGRPLDRYAQFEHEGQFFNLRFNEHGDIELRSTDGSMTFDDDLKKVVRKVIKDEISGKAERERMKAELHKQASDARDRTERKYRTVFKPEIHTRRRGGYLGPSVSDLLSMESEVEVSEASLLDKMFGGVERDYVVKVHGKTIHMPRLDHLLYLHNDVDEDTTLPHARLQEWLSQWTEPELRFLLIAMRGINALGHAEPHHTATLSVMEWWDKHKDELNNPPVPPPNREVTG